MHRKIIAAALGVFFLVPMNERAHAFSFLRLFSHAPKPVGHVLSNGFERQVSAVSNSSGNFTAAFFPLPNESGLYTLFAAAPAVVTHAAQSSFTIVGFGFNPASFNATLSANSTFTFTVALQNTGASAITGLAASTASFSGSGVSLTLDPASLPSSLAAGQSANLNLTLAALPSATTSTLSLSVAESHGFVRTLPITATVVPAQVFPVATPNNLLIGMLGGTIKTQVVTLTNQGFQTWRGVSLSNPALSWVTIQGNQNIGDIPPGGNVNFTLSIAPPGNLPNATYSPNPLLQALSLNAPPLNFQASITVTSALTGDVLVNVINADKPRDPLTGQGVGVPGSTVTLVSLDVQGLTFNANSDANGSAKLTAIPSGNYAWHVSAAGFQTMSGTAIIQPGIVNQIQAVIPTSVVSYQWSVTPTTILDRYNITLNLTFLTNVNAPALIVDPPVINLNLSSGQTAFTQFTITNKGLVSAFNVTLTPSNTDPDMQITLPFGSIPEIKAQQTVTVPVQVTLLHASCHNQNINVTYQYTCQFGTLVQTQTQPVSLTAGNSCPVSGAPGTAPPPGGGGGGGFGFTGGSQFIAATIPGNSPTPACQAPPGAGGPGNNWAANPSCGLGTSPATGGYSSSDDSFGFPAGSPPNRVSPRYNSSHIADSPFGFGWASNLTDSLQPDANGNFTFTGPDGSQVTFTSLGPLNQPLNGNGAMFAQPVSYYSTLNCGGAAGGVSVTQQPVTMSLRSKDGTVEVFQQFDFNGPVTVPVVSGGSGCGAVASGLAIAPSTHAVFVPISLTDRNGNTVTYSRNGAFGRLNSVTDIHGRTITFTYNGQGKIVTATDSTGRATQYGYDSNGNQISQTDPNGDITQYQYDSSHRLTQITYPNGGHHNLSYASATDNRVVSESDDNGNNAQSYVYFGSSVASPTGTAVGSTTVTDALGHLTQYAWQEVSGLRKFTKIIDPLGNATAFAYDTNMNLVSQTDPLGRTTKYSYDTLGNIIAATDANGGTTQISYEQTFSQPTNVTDPNANKTNLFYDAVGDLTQVQDAANKFTSMAYDSQGHVTATKDPLGNVTAFKYDGNGALTSVADPLNRTTNMTRDALSRVTQNTDPAGKQTAFTYDAQSNLTQVTDALSGLTKYNYAPGRTGRLLGTVTDAKSHATSFGYDNIARLTTVTNALSQVKNFSYDAKGNLSQVVDAKGQTINFSYDSLDRLITKKLPEGNVTYTYDFVGNLTQVSNYNGSVVAMSYDNLSRVVQVKQTLPGGFTATIGYTYDANGNRIGMTTPWGNFNYTYDALNRLISISNPQGKIFTFAYDSLGRRTKLDYPNGIETTYVYDSASQLAQILHRRLSDNMPIAFANYTYDGDKNRTSTQDMNGTHSYGYDNVNRLISATHPNASVVSTKSEIFNYDAVGNRTADTNISGYSYDAANRLQSNSSFTYTSDGNGNQIGKRDVSNNQTSYVYDSQNELVQVNLPGGIVTSYKYDGLGRRVFRSTGSATGQTVQYIYDNQDILAMLDGNNNIFAIFTHGPGIDEPLIMRRADGIQFFLHADGVGSIVAHTDFAGNVIERIEDGAYGQPVFVDVRGPPVISNQSFTGSPYVFTAREFDAETGLFYFRERYYDPTAGRFLSQDTDISSQLGGYGYYAYGADNPLTFRDVYGFRPLYNIGPISVNFPVPNPGAVDANIALIENMSNEGILNQWLWYANMVRTGGPWDYKGANADFRAFGDFNYGATAAALGLNEKEVLWFAGAYQFFFSPGLPSSLSLPSIYRFGSPFSGPPYGDDPKFVPYIRAGVRYYQHGHRNSLTGGQCPQ